jgi:hypothetical protein
MMTDTMYGKRVRARESFNKKVTRNIMGKDKQAHSMTIQRKSAPGISQFADVTKPMPAEKLAFVRHRAKRTAHEAIQRQVILNLPFIAIHKRIIG